jgi:hypothetical protein
MHWTKYIQTYKLLLIVFIKCISLLMY